MPWAESVATHRHAFLRGPAGTIASIHPPYKGKTAPWDYLTGSGEAPAKPPQARRQHATPAPALDLEPADAVERRQRERRRTRKGDQALIIDDSPTVVAALRKILRSAGYNTLEALDAEKGLALMAQEPPDLVFLDIILPGMNGFNALRLIRKNPATQHIPVIMISGNEHATEQFYANRIGADDFMKKPFSRFEILRA